MKMITNPEVATIAEELERNPELMAVIRNYQQLSNEEKARITKALIDYFHECKSTGIKYSCVEEMEQDFRSLAMVGADND